MDKCFPDWNAGLKFKSKKKGMNMISEQEDGITKDEKSESSWHQN